MAVDYYADWHDLSPHFAPEEIFSPDTIDKGRHVIDPEAIIRLNEFRDALGVALFVNFASHRYRGVRSPVEQQRVQRWVPTAAELSMHVCGKAFDISSERMSPMELRTKALEFGWHGVGLYDSFVHIDLRTLYSPNAITWDYRSGAK